MFQVLKASKNKKPEPNNPDSKPSSQNATPTPNSEEQSTHHANKKQRIQEKITYEDLDTPDDNKSSSKLHLNLSKVLKTTVIYTVK